MVNYWDSSFLLFCKVSVRSQSHLEVMLRPTLQMVTLGPKRVEVQGCRDGGQQLCGVTLKMEIGLCFLPAARWEPSPRLWELSMLSITGETILFLRQRWLEFSK